MVLKSRHGWVFTSHRKLWMWLHFDATISACAFKVGLCSNCQGNTNETPFLRFGAPIGENAIGTPIGEKWSQVYININGANSVYLDDLHSWHWTFTNFGLINGKLEILKLTLRNFRSRCSKYFIYLTDQPEVRQQKPRRCHVTHLNLGALETFKESWVVAIKDRQWCC